MRSRGTRLADLIRKATVQKGDDLIEFVEGVGRSDALRTPWSNKRLLDSCWFLNWRRIGDGFIHTVQDREENIDAESRKKRQTERYDADGGNVTGSRRGWRREPSNDDSGDSAQRKAKYRRGWRQWERPGVQ